MKHSRLLNCLIQLMLTATLAAPVVAQVGHVRPVTPLVQEGVCPFECCQFGRWVARTPLTVFAEEGDTAGVAFMIAPGDSFTAVTGNIHMEKLGVVIVTRRVESFNIGDTLYTLSYTGEGTIDIWYKGEIHNIGIFWPTDDEIDFSIENKDDAQWEGCSGFPITKPVMVWWVQVALRNGQTGWLRLVNRTVAGFSIDEWIDGMDACS